VDKLEESAATEDERSRTSEGYTLAFLQEMSQKLERNIRRVFKGDPRVVRNVLLCMLADGHVLLEDVPGVGKTVLAQSVAKSIQGEFKRIQFTPDMLPSDVLGISVYREDSRDFQFMPGPIFGNVILADEINRTTPRTQASLLECMNDAVVTVDGKSQVLPKPFFVIGTQNPMDHHGTYPLPQAQLDRFLMRLSIGYPDGGTEHQILSSQANDHPLSSITYVVRTMDIVQCTALIRQVHVAEAIKHYIIALANATREHPALNGGISPRASLALMRAVQALAAYSGRRYVMPDDVRELAAPVLAHRLQLKLRARAEYADTAAVIAEVIRSVPDDADAETTGS
jgi:MoxR-like ATPase